MTDALIIPTLCKRLSNSKSRKFSLTSIIHSMATPEDDTLSLALSWSTLPNTESTERNSQTTAELPEDDSSNTDTSNRNVSIRVPTIPHISFPSLLPFAPNLTHGVHLDERFPLMTKEIRKTYWWIHVIKDPLPSQQMTKDALDTLAGVTGIDINESLNVIWNVNGIDKFCDVQVRKIVSMGMTSPIDVHNVFEVLRLAQEVETGTHNPSFRFQDIEKGNVIGVAASYKHGLHIKLSRERIAKGLFALRSFVKPGIKVSIWVDSIFRQKESKVKLYNPNMRWKSWASHGLLPYHLFPVLCIGNKASEREEKEWVDSFWLNIEGTMGCLGSGLIFSDPDCTESPVSSWYVNHPMRDHNFVVVDPDPSYFAAYKRGGLLSTTHAMQHVLKIAAEGGFADKIVTFQEDKDKLEEMANYMVYAHGWEQVGLVLYNNVNSLLSKEILEQEITKPPRTSYLGAVERTSFSVETFFS